jgi:hypothetical protein
MCSDYEVILARSFDLRDVAISVPELFRKQEAWYGAKKWNTLSCYFQQHLYCIVKVDGKAKYSL